MSAFKTPRSKRASIEQKETLVHFLIDHRDFANDRFTSNDGVHVKQNMWNELATQLNALGGAVKTGEQWQKYWQDQRREVKKRAADVHIDQQQTGGGQQKIKPLSNIEEVILSIITPQAAIGNVIVAEGGMEINEEISLSSFLTESSESIQLNAVDLETWDEVQANEANTDAGLLTESFDTTNVAGPSNPVTQNTAGKQNNGSKRARRFNCRSYNPPPKRARVNPSDGIFDTLQTISQNDTNRLKLEEKSAEAALLQANAFSSLANSLALFASSSIDFQKLKPLFH